MEISEHAHTEMIGNLMNGLAFDGGHHKQYYLEQTLKYLVGEDEMRRMKEEEEWEDGIPA